MDTENYNHAAEFSIAQSHNNFIVCHVNPLKDFGLNILAMGRKSGFYTELGIKRKQVMSYLLFV